MRGLLHSVPSGPAGGPAEPRPSGSGFFPSESPKRLSARVLSVFIRVHLWFQMLFRVGRDAAAGGFPIGFDLARVDGLLEVVVGLRDVRLIGFRSIFQVGLLPVEEILVRHGV